MNEITTKLLYDRIKALEERIAFLERELAKPTYHREPFPYPSRPLTAPNYWWESPWKITCDNITSEIE